MNKYFNKIIISFLAVIFSLVSFSQDVTFTMQTGIKKAGITDRFHVTFTCNQQGRLVTPKFKNFTIVSGISQGSNSSIRIVNGRQTVSRTYTFQMVVQPKKIGKHTIEGTSIIVSGKTYKSNSLSIEIVKESQARKQPQRRSIFDDFFGQQQRRQQAPPEIDEKSFFTKITISKSKLYKNEHFIATYKLYSRGVRFGIEKYDFPTQKNFWTENIKVPENIKPVNEKIDGINYQVFTFKKEVLFPQKSGKLKLVPFEITARVNQSIFNQGQQKILKSNAPTITVNSLPNNAPKSFDNQVGDYKLSVDFKTDTITVDESIDMKITIKGKGNLKQMTGLNASFPEKFEVYDPEIKDRISVSAGGISGSKSFNYLLIPRKAGKYTIEPIEFSFFNPKTKQYKTLSTEKYELTVLNEDGTINDAVILNEKEEGKEIVKAEESESNFNWINVLIPVGILCLGFLLFLFIKKRKSKEETEEDRLKNARKKLAKNLETAKNHLDKNEISGFYDEILIGLNKYVNDKLQLKTAEMNKENIVKNLQNKRVGEATISSFVSLIEQCEMAKYSPLSTSNNHEIYEKSLDVIGEIEKEI